MGAFSQWGAAQWGAIWWGGEEETEGGGTISVTASDSISITDGTVELLGVGLDVSDALLLFDTQTLFTPDASFPSLYTSDLFVLLDAVQATIPGVVVLTQTAVDSFTITDAVGGQFAGLYVAVGDTLTFLDNYNYLTASAADSFTISDQYMGSLNYLLLGIQPPVIGTGWPAGNNPFTPDTGLGVSDGIQVLNLDSATGLDILVPTRTDTLALSDSQLLNLGIAEVPTDTISLSDGATLQELLALVVSDSFTITDAALVQSPLTPPVPDVMDFLVLTDSVQLLKLGFYDFISTDLVSLTDNIDLTGTEQETGGSSTVSFSDGSTLTLYLNVVLADDMSFTDVVVDNNPNTPTINLVIPDTLAIVDFINYVDGGSVVIGQLMDSFSLTDSVDIYNASSITAYLRRYLNDVVCPSNVG